MAGIFSIFPLGQEAVLCTLSSEISQEINDRVMLITRKIKSMKIPGIVEVQPAYSSFCVHFLPSQISFSDVVQMIQVLCRKLTEGSNEDGMGGKNGNLTGQGSPRVVEIPVLYGGENGPDLDWAADYLGLSREEIIRRHSQRLYPVYMMGFTPGFPYLGGLDPTIAMPRLPRPRTRVPKGSVGIAGNQTGIYPLETPGGWRIIGRTPIELFSPWNDPPSLLEPGDLVRFVPISPEEYASYRESAESRTAEACRDSEGFDSLPCFEVVEPGFYSLVVDQGRKGFRSYGIPVSGPCDEKSYMLANSICGNKEGDAAIEFAVKGPKLTAKKHVVLAVTGSPTQVMVDGRRVPMNQPVQVNQGSTVEIGELRYGLRGYLAVSGGIWVPKVLGSRSTYVPGKFGGVSGRPLKRGDILNCGIAGAKSPSLPEPIGEDLRFLKLGFSQPAVRIIPGPEYSLGSLAILTSNVYTVSNDSDRMGLRLLGPGLTDRNTDIVSSPCVPGVIQVSSDGTPMIMLQDSQTTGGYRRIATVLREDLSLLGQVRPGQKIRFRLAWTLETKWALQQRS